MSHPTYSHNGRSLAIFLNRIVYQLSRHWLLFFSLLLLLFIGLPWLAPVFMMWGWTEPAKAIYFFYSIQCHQMPQRSFFLFGSQWMYSLPNIQAAWQPSDNPLILRQFIGNTAMGWKVAWSDRMVYMYTSLLLAGLVYWPFRRKIKPLPWWGFLLLLLPMALDGSTHMVSDVIGGIGGGFRFNNEWLTVLTGNLFPVTFYVGDAPGSFNSWMRILSGLCFGIGVVWFLYPRINEGFDDTARQIEDKFLKSEQRQRKFNE
ncbi:MAG: DUF2085 domain-containing protein [Chloroflexota bacterium]